MFQAKNITNKQSIPCYSHDPGLKILEIFICFERRAALRAGQG